MANQEGAHRGDFGRCGVGAVQLELGKMERGRGCVATLKKMMKSLGSALSMSEGGGNRGGTRAARLGVWTSAWTVGRSSWASTRMLAAQESSSPTGARC